MKHPTAIERIAEHTRQMNRTFPFDISDHLRYRIFRRDRDQHVYMISRQVPFLYPAYFVFCQFLEYLSKVWPQLFVQYFSSTLRYQYHMIISNCYGLGFCCRPSTPFIVCLAAHDSECRRWTPVNVTLLLSPRHSRGISYIG
jgi:hypothetical protein